MRAYIRQHYRRRPEYYIAKAKVRNEDYRRDVLLKLREYLKVHPCVDCGETDFVVLEFDHIDPGVKSCAVSELIRRQWSWAKVAAEIAKCEVRCANCHRRRTARQQGWYAP